MENQVNNEDATKQQVEQLLAQLTDSQKAYDEWRQTQPVTFDEVMAAWISMRDRQRFYSADEVAAWKGQEPGISSRPEVIETRRKIAEPEVDLHNQKTELKRLLSIGTPYSTYRAAVEQAETMIGGLLQRLKKQRIEGVLVATYGHCNFGKLARPMTEQARLHPSVVQLETFSFVPRLSALRDAQITQAAVDAAASKAVKALQDLLEL